MGSIVTVVLASQPGEGFAASRWTVPWGATTLLGHVLAEARTWPPASGLVVLGDNAETVLDEVDMVGFSVLVDPEWAEGEAASLRASLDYLQRDDAIEAILLVSGAMPLVPPGTVEQLLAAHDARTHPATVPKYRYAWGRPLILDRQLWPRLLGLEGGTTVEAVLATHTKWVSEVWIDHLPPSLVTRPDDIETLAPRR